MAATRTTASFSDPQVATINRLSLKDAQLVISQEALRRGALTSSELTARSGPVEAVRVSLRSPLWATTVATVYFPTETAASQWAHDLLSRLPRIERPKSGARAPVWRLQLSAARLLGTHVVGGAVIAVLEPDYGPELRASLEAGMPAGAPPRATAESEASPSKESLVDLAGAIAMALKTVKSTWITGTVARVTRARSGNVFLALEGKATAFDAVIFSALTHTIGDLPREGERIDAHVARVSLYQPRGQLSLVLDGIREAGHDRAA